MRKAGKTDMAANAEAWIGRAGAGSAEPRSKEPTRAAGRTVWTRCKPSMCARNVCRNAAHDFLSTPLPGYHALIRGDTIWTRFL